MGIEEVLAKKGIHMNEDLDRLFDSPKVNLPFQGLHTEHLQNFFIEDHFERVVGKLESSRFEIV